jgi:putative nucleotidyltransferase with HDIG domain
MNSKLEVIEKIKNDEIIKKIIDFSKNTEVYVVGGCVRDCFLGAKNFDKDLVVENSRDFAVGLAEVLDGKFIPLDEEFKIYRIILKDKITCIDIAAPIGGSIQADLLRRDLTINSIAVNLKTFELLDIAGGISDLENKKINMISEENIIDDPLRILRAYRFAATLGFDIEENFARIIEKHATEISKPAQERVNYELLKLFGGDFASQILLDMDAAGLLEVLFPVINELKKVPKNAHHHLDLFHHSIETVRQLELIYQKSEKRVIEHMNCADFGGATRIAHLKLAAFLHDIGKFSTWSIDEDGRHRFIKHNDVGAKMAEKILRKSKFSKKQIEYISKMIKFHIYPSNVIAAPNLTEKVYMRFVRKMDADAVDIILLAQADRLSARGVEITQKIVDDNINGLANLMTFYLDVKESLKPLPKLLTGNDIMNIFKLPPSPKLGEVINELKEAQISGDVNTKEEAIAYVSGMLNG